jgi:F0F1-type ATP synthase assembly protein I
VSRLTAGSRRFLTFTGMALEMGVLIFIGLWLGKRMDRWLELEKPWFMMLFTLLFTAAAIYRVIRSLR